MSLCALTSMLFLLLNNQISEAALKCKYGQQTVCGSDGFTYFNMCDFEIVKSVRPNLTVKYPGSCRAEDGPLLSTLTKILNQQQPSIEDNVEVLRRNKKNRRRRWSKMHTSDLTKILLSQMSNVQTNLDAFNFGNNSLQTQGDSNIFQISIGNK